MSNLNPVANLNEIEMLIKALSAEVHDQHTVETQDGEVLTQMEEALFELRVRKMLLAER